MPSNSTFVCFNCRIGFKHTWTCPNCRQPLTDIGKRISIPRKNNIRMWKRMENGERKWNRRRVRRGERWGKSPDTITVYQYEIVDHIYEFGNFSTKVKRKRRIEGTGREVTNFRKKPVVDLGG